MKKILSDLFREFQLLAFLTILLVAFSCKKESVESNLMGSWQIEIDGKTFNMNEFSVKGTLLITEMIQASGNLNYDNGINPLEIGLAVGNPPDNPQIGSIWFGTNSAICKELNIGCNSVPINAALDLAFVKIINQNKIEITIDGRFYENSAVGASLTGFLNLFNASSGLTAKSYQIISGTIIIEIHNEKEITGSIDLKGSSLSGFAPVDYNATFYGYK